MVAHTIVAAAIAEFTVWHGVDCRVERKLDVIW